MRQLLVAIFVLGGWLAQATASQNGRIVRLFNEGNDPLYIALAKTGFMNMTIACEGWKRLNPGGSIYISDPDLYTRIIAVGIAMVKNNVFGAVRYPLSGARNTVHPCKGYYPVRLEGFKYWEYGDNFRVIQVPRDGFAMMPFSFYIEEIGGGSLDISISVDENSEFIPLYRVD